MAAKIKFNTTHLITIIVVQIIAIDLLLIAFFVRHIYNTQEGAFGPFGKNAGFPGISQEKSVSRGFSPYLHSITHPLEGLVRQVCENERRAGTLRFLKDIRLGNRRTSSQIVQNSDPLRSMYGKHVAYKPVITAPKPIRKDTVKEGTFIATTYDLSYASCGKYPTHPAYGVTFSGRKAVKGRTVAVDPKVIPLGSRLHIEFPPPYSNMTGWYTAEDTGNAVKGNIIDVFLGESAFYEMERFGSRIVKARIYPPETKSGSQVNIERK